MLSFAMLAGRILNGPRRVRTAEYLSPVCCEATRCTWAYGMGLDGCDYGVVIEKVRDGRNLRRRAVALG